VPNPDAVLIASEALIATADSAVLDRCQRWTNLARGVINQQVRDASVVRLADEK
jgi:hypothetical protein